MQKSRVSLALITWTKPQVMLLDEPTNHLDLVSGATVYISMRIGLYLAPHLTPTLRCTLVPKPTLSKETVSALIEALLEFTGGILVVSHDEHLITAVCDTLWIAGEGTVRHSKGDFQDYKQQCL